MKSYKYANKEKTSILIIDNETGQTIQTPINRIIKEIGDSKIGRFSNNDPSDNDIARLKAKSIRVETLVNSTVKVKGKVFQTRLSDRALLIDTIAMLADGETTEWILSNNNVSIVSKEDLAEVLRLGRLQGKEAFDTYIEELKALGMVE